jgi:hypothetical protein
MTKIGNRFRAEMKAFAAQNSMSSFPGPGISGSASSAYWPRVSSGRSAQLTICTPLMWLDVRRRDLGEGEHQAHLVRFQDEATPLCKGQAYRIVVENGDLQFAEARSAVHREIAW